MRKLTAAWRSLFDVRPGEYRRTVFMSLYLLFVLFAYYVLKSASESMFLNKFDIDKLPNLYILMAIFGGALAYVYSKLAARTSLRTAVTWTMFLSIACLVAMWFPLRFRQPTMVYVFAVWVRLFSVVTVTQGWVVASNLFDPREAKRVYGLLGMGMVLGAVFGGEFTTQMVRFIGTDNLLFASAPLVLLAYGSYLIAVSGKAKAVATAKAAGAEEVDFSFKDVANDIARNRHLQVLIGLMTMQFIVDTLIDYQFKYMAKQAYHGDALTAFLGRFYGRYLNLTEIALQFFFTTAVVRRLGVGGTLQVMPISLAAASVFTFVSPSVLSASLARLVEASTRYTLSRTGTELFYMPLPLELRNRIKAFIDIFVDRAARGISGLMLILFTQLKFGVRGVAVVTIVITIPWIWFTVRAHREYVRTIRKRLEARRLDFDSARITVGDADTIRMLETTAFSANPRQAAYALSMLGATHGYEVQPVLLKLAESPLAEVRAEVYTLARIRGGTELTARALDEIRNEEPAPAIRQAVVYLLTVSPDKLKLSRELLDSPNPDIQDGVVEALTAQPHAASEIITHEWISANVRDTDWRRRALTASVVAARGDQGTEAIYWLLADPHPRVAEAACRAAGSLRNRGYVFAIARLLANYRVRGAAIEALAQYGSGICGTLGDMLDDEGLPLSVRVNIPRALRRIPHQRTVDVLLEGYKNSDAAVSDAALKALARMREAAPTLTVEAGFLKQHIINEAHRYYEISGALSSLDDHRDPSQAAVSLLARSLEERQRRTMKRLFRLLGLRYPSNEMYWAYLALSRKAGDRHTTAVEFLDNVLDQDLKRVIVPMLDAPERLREQGQTLFGVEPQSAEATIRGLLHSGDSWLAACAMAAAAELRLRALAADIAEVAKKANAEVSEVGRSAVAVLT
jgi:AAA family ATP:ADP antiporter